MREIPAPEVGRSRGRGWPGPARERWDRRRQRLRGLAQGLVRRRVGGIRQIRCWAGRVRYGSRRHDRPTLRKPRRLGQDIARLRSGRFRQGIASRKAGGGWMPVGFRPGATVTVRRRCCSSPCPLRVAPCGLGGMIRPGGSRSRRRRSCGGPGQPARVVAVLRQRRWVADQSGLNSRERMGNLDGALEVVAGGARLLVGGPVVLVDDLMTTGASLREAARAVREAITGGGEVGATGAVYARVSREGREEHIDRSNGRSIENGRDMALSAPGIVRVNGPADLICAAVIAASPDSFEINRN